jgi:NAD(P)-dependent dehydrogenase (short-subunit alcohol dehydrogenase family)
MSGKLNGRRLVLTGISRGIGFETARRFLSEGAEILGIARDAMGLAQAEQKLEKSGAGRLTTLVVDISQAGAEQQIFRAVDTRWGALDILINNAAIMIDSDATQGLLDEAPDTFERTLTTNLVAPFRIARVFIPLLLKGREPRIIHLTSGAGCFAAMTEPGIASYRLSKWALNGLTVLMARELAGKIAVNGLDPGWVKTDLGGPLAPGSPVESAQGALALATAPFSETGKLWKNGAIIPF